jgi:hypothetical protein
MRKGADEAREHLRCVEPILAWPVELFLLCESALPSP